MASSATMATPIATTAIAECEPQRGFGEEAAAAIAQLWEKGRRACLTPFGEQANCTPQRLSTTPVAASAFDCFGAEVAAKSHSRTNSGANFGSNFGAHSAANFGAHSGANCVANSSRSRSRGFAQRLPPVIVDPHHHFYDSQANPALHTCLASFFGEHTIKHCPECYMKAASGLSIAKTVHIECLPDNGVAEESWVARCAREGRCKVAGIVASCDPAAEDLAEQMRSLKAKTDFFRGIRWILNYDGPLQPGETPIVSRATWPNVTADYLRNPQELPKLEAMLSAMAEYGLSFDLQCNPSQLQAAAELFSRHPTVPFVLCHIGHPRGLTMAAVKENEDLLSEWRAGMRALAALPQAHVKLSMFGYAVPNWHADPEQEELAKSLARWVIDLFGANRCMFASNWPVDGMGESHNSSNGLTLPNMYAKYYSWVQDLNPAQRDALFHLTATKFYRI